MVTTSIREKTTAPESQCDSCRHAHVIAGYRESETIVYCNYIWKQPIAIPFKVRECSSYVDKSKPSWQPIKEPVVSIVETTSAKTIGFKVPILVPDEDRASEEVAAEE